MLSYFENTLNPIFVDLMFKYDKYLKTINNDYENINQKEIETLLICLNIFEGQKRIIELNDQVLFEKYKLLEINMKGEIFKLQSNHILGAERFEEKYPEFTDKIQALSENYHIAKGLHVENSFVDLTLRNKKDKTEIFHLILCKEEDIWLNKPRPAIVFRKEYLKRVLYPSEVLVNF
jgi:hypothetical protein